MQMNPPNTTTTAFRESLARVHNVAIEHVTRSAFAATLKRIVPRRVAEYSSHHDEETITNCVLDLAIHTPDPKGRTVYHRLPAHALADLDETDQLALARLKAARFRVVRAEGTTDAGRVAARDILDGSACVLPAVTALPGELMAARFVTSPDGSWIPGSLVLKLPEGRGMIADIRTTRDGAAFRNSARAAETLYRRVIEAGLTSPEGLPAWMVVHPLDVPAPETTFADGRLQPHPAAPQIIHDLVALSEDWMELEAADPATADPDGTAWLRGESTPDVVCTLLTLMDHVPRGQSQHRALDAMALVALDTVTYRAALGLEETMEDFLAQTERDGMGLPRHLQDHLQALQQRLAARTGGAASPGLEGVIARIRALRAKTQQAGCTEAEAMAAAEKAEELLRKYDITLTPEDLDEQTCDLARFPTDRKRSEGFDLCVAAIADFCECWSWIERDETNTMTHAIFGMPADVEAARALYHVVSETFATETKAFKAGGTYKATPSNDRAQATRSFRMGLANGIRDKLQTLKRERVRQTQQATGQDLVPVKTRTMQAALDRLGLHFQHERKPRRRLVDPESYRQGVASGQTFQPDPALKSPSA